MKQVKKLQAPKIGHITKQHYSPSLANTNKNSLYANVSPRYLEPKSTKNIKKTTQMKSPRVKTADVEEIKQIAEKHYHKAMKYVYKKNTLQQQIKSKQEAKLNLKQQPLTNQHTFAPKIRNNKYNQRIQQLKGENKKHIELYNWGMNHKAIRRQNMIQGQVKQIRKSLQKQYRSLQKSRNSSLQRSLQKSLQKSINKSLISTVSRQTVTKQIPGVKKYYLNQAKAQIQKTKRQKLMFRGNDVTGYYF